ncbi:hypothetical protein AKJ09_06368 [Labilithrix luteola]|uniref:Uncharacterized protein n=1 Tax=Labilithrix luteola TaxID=1391654 RepID=A0A0K1Q2W1_9BACT|nr:hypothetical protein [Labilithrix luteola]AKU99704.1 hypothetical protein AKJ09_06368 [Labilithrix luteola]
MTPARLIEVDEWERALAAGEELEIDCLAFFYRHLRRDTIDAIYGGLGEASRASFLSRARAQLQNFDDLVNAASGEGINPETYFVIREWVYRQPFSWRTVPLETLSKHIERGVGSPARLFEEVIPLMQKYPVDLIVSPLKPGWRNRLRDFGRGLGPGLDVVCETARRQGADVQLIRAFVSWAKSTKLERTRWERGE